MAVYCVNYKTFLINEKRQIFCLRLKKKQLVCALGFIMVCSRICFQAAVRYVFRLDLFWNNAEYAHHTNNSHTPASLCIHDAHRKIRPTKHPKRTFTHMYLQGRIWAWATWTLARGLGPIFYLKNLEGILIGFANFQLEFFLLLA